MPRSSTYGWLLALAVAEALGKLGDERAIHPLSRCLEDDDESVRNAAAAALDKLRKQPGRE